MLPVAAYCSCPTACSIARQLRTVEVDEGDRREGGVGSAGALIFRVAAATAVSVGFTGEAVEPYGGGKLAWRW